jgi:hypothetical protein
MEDLVPLCKEDICNVKIGDLLRMKCYYFGVASLEYVMILDVAFDKVQMYKIFRCDNGTKGWVMYFQLYKLSNNV